MQISNNSPDDELELLYRDDQVVVINKPSGLLVHRSPIDRHETRFALQLLRDQLGQRVYPVHRLDKPTSGVLVFALTPEIARGLSEQFQNRTLDKHYLAVTRGYTLEEGKIDHPLSDKPDKIADRNRQQPRPPQQAITHYRRLATMEIPVQVDRYPQSRFSLVSLKPVTGRKHQLRRHLKHIGHPIIGDAKHGKGVYNRYFAEHLNCNRLLLACTSLTFSHPGDGELITVNAPLDDTFCQLLQRFGWSVNN